MAAVLFPRPATTAVGPDEPPRAVADGASRRFPIHDGSRLELFFFHIKRSQDRYLIVRGDGKRSIATEKPGTRAVRLLDEGRSIAETKQALGREFDCEAADVDLTPLIDSLFHADFVRRLDGRRTPSRLEQSVTQIVRSWFLVFVFVPLSDFVIRYLPLSLTVTLTHLLCLLRPRKDIEQRIVTNLRSVPCLSMTERGMSALGAASLRNVQRARADTLLLDAMEPARVHQWVTGATRISGLDNLTSATGRGGGAIVCSFHMGSFSLVPFILGAEGIPLTVYGDIGDALQRSIARSFAALKEHGGGYPVSVITRPMAPRTLMKRLRRGETVLVYCDQEIAEADGPTPAPGPHSVGFLGRGLHAMRGVGWLQWKTGASVIPAVLLWEGSRRHHLIIEPRLVFPAASGASEQIGAVTGAVFGVLERYVRRDPAQWLKWKDLHKMTAEVAGGTLPNGSTPDFMPRATGRAHNKGGTC